MRLAWPWARNRRRRAARGTPDSPLHVCGGCGEPDVHPVEWAESGAKSWWLLLRCGNCDEWQEVFAGDDAVEAYDRHLDRGLDSIQRDADQLEHERLAAQDEAFAQALRLNLIGADDFR